MWEHWSLVIKNSFLMGENAVGTNRTTQSSNETWIIFQRRYRLLKEDNDVRTAFPKRKLTFSLYPSPSKHTSRVF